MNTPYEIIVQVVDETRAGTRTPEAFQNALDILSDHLTRHAQELESLQPPLEYRDLHEAAQEGYRLFAEALATLPEDLDEGLVLAQEAHELLAEVQQESADNFERLDSDL